MLVLGAGPAGLAAAAAASERGQLVTLVDDNPHPGGQIWRGGPGQWRDGRADALWTLVCQRPNVRLILGARVLSAPAPQELLLEIEGRAHSIGWQRLILCSGARELLLPFSGWTLPGVTGAGGLQALIKGGMSIAGKRVVVAGSGPLLLAVADTVRRHHGSVVAIAEHRPLPGLVAFFAQLSLRHRGKLWQALGLFRQLAGVRYRTGATVVAATGERQLRSVTLRQGGRQIELACDFLACGYGLVPNLELATLLGCRVDQGKVQVDGEQLSSRANVWAAGEATGIGGVDKALAEGHIAGMRATEGTPAPSVRAARHRALRFAGLLARRFGPTPALRALCKQDTIVCRCEDVLAAQLAEHCDWRTAKVLTRVGMGPCQGRICGAACAFLYGWQTPGLRLPVFPAAASILAAEHSAACTKEIES
ncbi:MAG: FAD/NAD(P)-binding oxidoreductase [Pseudomonadota bacterium]|nr:FAD/NAD(P)-binding oxidoreductase [Pseudomonadota bacterium]